MKEERILAIKRIDGGWEVDIRGSAVEILKMLCILVKAISKNVKVPMPVIMSVLSSCVPIAPGDEGMVIDMAEMRRQMEED